MNSRTALECLATAVAKDPSITVARADVETCLGQDARYLSTLGLEKPHLIRLERLGFALKARYQTTNRRNSKVTGPHRVRWVLFTEGVSDGM